MQLNRLACLRLTERCAEILLSVREEIKEAGEQVGDELAMPIEKLVRYALTFWFSDNCVLICGKLIYRRAHLHAEASPPPVPQALSQARRDHP